MEKLKEFAPFIISFIMLLFLIALAHFMYVEYYTEVPEPILVEEGVEIEPGSFTRCLEASHVQQVEGLKARDQAMHAFAGHVNQFFVVSWRKLTDCF